MNDLPDILILYLHHKMMAITFSLILGHDFERILNTHCTHGETSFETLDHAKDECKLNEECTGIFQKNCTDNKNYYECLIFSHSGSVTCATGATSPGLCWKYSYQSASFLFIGAGGCQIFKEISIVMSMG